MSGPTGTLVLFRGSSKGRQPEDYLPKVGFQYSDTTRLLEFPPFTPSERDAWFDAFKEISDDLDKRAIDKAMASLWRSATSIRARNPGTDRHRARALAVEKATDELSWASRMGEDPLEHVMVKMERARYIDNRLSAFRRTRKPGACARAIDDFAQDWPQAEPDHTLLPPERIHDMAYRMRNGLRSDWNKTWFPNKKLRKSDSSWRTSCAGGSASQSPNLDETPKLNGDLELAVAQNDEGKDSNIGVDCVNVLPEGWRRSEVETAPAYSEREMETTGDSVERNKMESTSPLTGRDKGEPASPLIVNEEDIWF